MSSSLPLNYNSSDTPRQTSRPYWVTAVVLAVSQIVWIPFGIIFAWAMSGADNPDPNAFFNSIAPLLVLAFPGFLAFVFGLSAINTYRYRFRVAMTVTSITVGVVSVCALHALFR